MRAPTIYVGDHQHARVVCSAFAEGCGGKLVPATSGLRDGPAAMWGILRGAGDRIKECELYGIPYFYIDHGYFRRGHYDGYYRVVFCDRHLQGPPQPSDGERWEALGIEIQPWQKLEPKITYLPISRHVAGFLGLDAGEFDEEQTSRLRLTGMDVVWSPKGDEITDFTRSALVCGFQSNALVEAALAGHRVEELGGGPTRYLQHRPNGSMGEEPDREAVFRCLADNQWTLAEMRSGKCWSDLMERYGDALSDALAA